MSALPATVPLYWEDPYLRTFQARVVALGDAAVALDRTAFYPTGGGQPHDLGSLAGASVVEVSHGAGEEEAVIWHRLGQPGAAPGGGGAPGSMDVGTVVEGTIDWPRRHALMRGHTALHVLCGVLCDDYHCAVTGGNIAVATPQQAPAVALARLDVSLGPVPEAFAAVVERRANEELSADRPVEVRWLAREVALADRSLVRTQEVLVPAGVETVRVVDIVGLDSQADGGLHVRSTSEVGRVRVSKVESKGRGHKRVRIEVLPPQGAPEVEGAMGG